MRPQPLICVSDVDASSRWYARLLNCEGAHATREYARLFSNGVLILQLHTFEDEHHHGPLGNPDDKPYGNGLLLWFELEDFDSAVQRAHEMQAEIVMPRHRNARPDHWELWLRDPDGYTVVVVSPDGTAPA